VLQVAIEFRVPLRLEVCSTRQLRDFLVVKFAGIVPLAFAVSEDVG